LGDFLPSFSSAKRAMRVEAKRTNIRDVLLARRGIAFVESRDTTVSEDLLRATELEFGAIGYVLSSRLRARLGQASVDELVRFRANGLAALLESVGGNRKHEPLFRRFPRGIPDNTYELWWTKVLVNFLQAGNQPCLFCRRVGTTHVLNPCEHVVCDHCFDGSNYSACPVCEHHVDRSSPFFRPSVESAEPIERIRFKIIDLGDDQHTQVRALFLSLCERKQALAPVDRDALLAILSEYRADVFDWVPRSIPVRENVAIIFGTLFKVLSATEVLPVAQRFLATATDVLRLIAVMSGTDGSLLPETRYRRVEREDERRRFWDAITARIGVEPRGNRTQVVNIPVQAYRFKVAKLSRALRRSLLSVLESMDADALIEDMLRHDSYWVWVGEFLHPHEYAARFPKVARAFQVIRKQAPDGTPAPKFRTWYSRLEKAIAGRDDPALLAQLLERPGEFARRLDHVLRLARDGDARERVVAALSSRIGSFATPVLLTLKAHLPLRTQRAPVRVYWPKGRMARGVSVTDERATLDRASVDVAVNAIDNELLRRFSLKPAFDSCLLDAELRNVIVPFNERTASRSAVSLPRGSRVAVPPGKLVRLFLHWCQPALTTNPTDLDLSVAFYDAEWKYVEVCSYYQLQAISKQGGVMARSAGDLRSAPWPDGATEFVDLDRETAAKSGIRYAVMVLNNYSGLPFGALERAFAGLMLRDDADGSHFDPRTVELKFALDGDNGMFMPLVLDLHTDTLHWLDVHSRGELALNNVETSNAAIRKIAPEQMAYFESGTRASMLDLGLMHAASRCLRVHIRKDGVWSVFRRASGEDPTSFYSRLLSGRPDDTSSAAPEVDAPPVMAILFRGNVPVPAGSAVYALFRERLTPTLVASDLLS
jgi:hypothetical protein